MDTQYDAPMYEIRLKGHLGQNTLVWFDDFDVEHTPDGETILRGPMADQAAVRGVLTRIFDLGLSLTLFRELGQNQVPAGAQSEN